MFKVSGRGGSSESSETYVPYEAENSLQSNTQARLLEFICSGRIKGPAIGDSWAKSLFLNETPVVSEDGTENFQGVTVDGRLGTSDQDYITGHGAIEIETDMLSVEITESGGPVAHSIVNGDIDDLRITLQWPYMVRQTDKGDLETTSVSYKITVTPDGGSGIEQTAIEKTLSGKCVSTYRNQHTIKNISQYGVSPWVVRVYRITADAADSKTENTMQWYSYTEITNAKMRHPNTALFGLIFDSKLFGDTLPSRALYIYGCDEIEYPANFNPETGEYTGIWDGETWETGWTDSAPWILRYLITNETNGLGLPESYVNKWSLYTVGQFSDEHIEHTRRYRQPNGTYATETITRPRFSFNGVIQDRGQALKVISNLASVFMGFPVWSSGETSFINDMPRDITRIACPANVIGGLFEYGPGSEKSARTTVVNVSYNDPDNFGRLTTYPVQDDDAIKKYGYNTADITAIGCNNAAEAIYRARHYLRTNNIQTDPISFCGGKEWADLEPGEIIGVQDPNYADVNLSGRIVSSTTTSITVDRDIEIEGGVTYTLIFPLADVEGSVERVLTNVQGITRELTWETAVDYAPNVALPWVLSSSSVAIRKFMALGAEEKDDGSYEVSGWEYDENKWDIIENGIIVDDPPDTTISSGAMSPPSGINIQTYTYTEGDHNIRKYGMLISWEKSTDTRLSHYRIIASKDGGGWYSLDGGDTAKTSYDYKGVTSGDYSFAVQSIGVSSQSIWVYYNDFVLSVGLNAPEPPTNLRCVDNPTQSYFTGKDCEIAWDASVGAEYTPEGSDDAPFTTADAAGDANVAGYKIEVYDGITLVRTAYTEGKSVLTWSYIFSMNEDDNGTPIRNINFRVYTMDVSGVASETYASLSASNPAPSMSSVTPMVVEYGGGISISWALVDDNDMLGYSIEVDGSEVAFINHPGNTLQYTNVEYGTDYDFEIIPYDEFGAGAGSISATGSPVKIPGVNVDIEVSGSITMSDSDGNPATAMAALYDGLISAGGVAYTISGTDKYIEYLYSITNYFDRASVCTSDANGQIYFALSEDGSTWTWLKAQTDHGLDSEDKLIEATDQADAVTNYWQLSAGQNIALFPNNIVAKKVRLYLTGSYSTTIFEFVPSRILISEMGAIKALSVLTEDAGLIRAGRLESFDGESYFDLDSGEMVIHSGSSGYVNLSDAPSSLSDLDSDAHTKLSEIEPGATNENRTEGGITYIPRPGGGGLSLNGPQTGVIKITLPQSWSNTMLKFVVDVYNYSADTSFSLYIGGYNRYITTEWRNTTANLTGNISGDNRVRFGHDGTYCAIYIGEIDTIWSYPKVLVRDFQCSHYTYSIDDWDDGWAVSIETSVGTITSDISDATIDANANWDNVYGTGKPEDNATLGANYLTNITNVPTSLNDINTTEYNYLSDPAGVINAGSTTINGGKITTGSIAANRIVSNSITAGQLAASCITASEVGTNQIISSSANIANLAVSTIKIANQAVTIPSSSYVSSGVSVSTSWKTLTSFSVTNTGSPVLVTGSTVLTISSIGIIVYIGVYRGSSRVSGLYTATLNKTTVSFSFTHKPSSGTATYYLKAYTSSGTITASYNSLSTLEAKK